MKTFLLVLLSVLGSFTTLQAQLRAEAIFFDGKNRFYYIYVPKIYSPEKAVPVVVYLHGVGYMGVEGVADLYEPNQFIPIADTANFILLVPVAEAFEKTGMRAWNSGAGIGFLGQGFSMNGDVDDKGFIEAMLDKVEGTYSVDKKRIYLCGFSMGGFMTQRMAIERNSRFAAFASVSGTIGGLIGDRTIIRDIPIAHFHGTNDPTISYTNPKIGKGAEETVAFWVKQNKCKEKPIKHEVYNDFDRKLDTLVSVDHYVYSNGKTNVEFFKKNESVHTWLSDDSKRIWLFMRKYRLEEE